MSSPRWLLVVQMISENKPDMLIFYKPDGTWEASAGRVVTTYLDMVCWMTDSGARTWYPMSRVVMQCDEGEEIPLEKQQRLCKG